MDAIDIVGLVGLLALAVVIGMLAGMHIGRLCERRDAAERRWADGLRMPIVGQCQQGTAGQLIFRGQCLLKSSLTSELRPLNSEPEAELRHG